MNYCDYCTNKAMCAECDETWRDKFVPCNEVKPYFRLSYINGKSCYRYSATNKDLVPTHHMMIDGTPYCPYCGERMLPIQNDQSLRIIGHMCICEGARAELEYERERKDMDLRHMDELSELEKSYRNRLAFCTDKLISIKHQKEMERIDRFLSSDFTLSHLSTQNSEPFTDIDQITKL